MDNGVFWVIGPFGVSWKPASTPFSSRYPLVGLMDIPVTGVDNQSILII